MTCSMNLEIYTYPNNDGDTAPQFDSKSTRILEINVPPAQSGTERSTYNPERINESTSDLVDQDVKENDEFCVGQHGSDMLGVEIGKE